MSIATPRRPVAAVIGAADPPPALLTAAEDLGRLLVDVGFRVATGGLGGVMIAACRGARSSRAPWTEARTLGFLPGLDPAAGNPYLDIVVPTGLNHARNVVLVSTADVVVAVGGGAGTLSELAMAWQHGKVMVGLDLPELTPTDAEISAGGAGDPGPRGWAAVLAGTVLDGRRADPIRRATSAAEAVALAVAALEARTDVSLSSR